MFLKGVDSQDEGQGDKQSSEMGFDGIWKTSSIAVCWPHLLMFRAVVQCLTQSFAVPDWSLLWAKRKDRSPLRRCDLFIMDIKMCRSNIVYRGWGRWHIFAHSVPQRINCYYHIINDLSILSVFTVNCLNVNYIIQFTDKWLHANTQCPRAQNQFNCRGRYPALGFTDKFRHKNISFKSTK